MLVSYGFEKLLYQKKGFNFKILIYHLIHMWTYFFKKAFKSILHGKNVFIYLFLQIMK